MKSTLAAGAVAARAERARQRAASEHPRPPDFEPEAKSGASPALGRLLAALAEPLPPALELEKVVELSVARLASALPGLALGAEVEDAQGTRVSVVRTRAGHAFELLSLDVDAAAERAHVREFEAYELRGRLFVASPEHGRALRAFHRQAIDVAANLLAARLGEGKALGRARRLGAELQRLEKLASLGKVVTNVLHELNNPLTSILAYTDRLASRLGAESDAEEHALPLRRIKESAERAQIFARDLVLYARPSPDLMVEVSLANVLDKATFLCEHEFSSAGVRTATVNELGALTLVGVPDQLVRVFVNLFTNAAHAMSERGGTLRITATADSAGEFAIVSVADEGEGVAPANLPRIFEPFFTTRLADRGAGLGLAIVRDILAAHGATIRVRSTPDVGTTFELRLPLSPTA